MKTKFVIVILMTVLVVVGCSTLGTRRSPYSICGECVLAADTNTYRYAGYDFVFYNATDKDVENFTLVLYVYDEEGRPLLAGTGCVVVRCEYFVAAGGEVTGSVSMDDHVTVIPTVALVADCVYVSEIVYADGTVWRDGFGFYDF